MRTLYAPQRASVPETRPKFQPSPSRARAVDVSIAGTTGGLSSGLVVAAAGYPVLALTGGVLALAILPVVAVTAYRR
ncbi:hypothetical protein ABZ357_40355 [Streptomyces sp. NPDC005917]|uniref:hypothetical protein n=1 Tax=unclassified Streptomyces TaxID=2593676 RepID=UPI0033ECA581